MVSPQPPLPALIDAPSLLALLGSPAGEDVLLLDTRFNLMQPEAGEAAWRAGHLPGACHAHLDRDLSGPKTGDNGRHPLPSLAALANTLARWGLTPATRVVAYDDAGGMFAARAWWLLRWVGHTRAQVLDGGIGAWQAAGGALDTQSAPRTPAPVRELAPQAGWLVQADEVLASLQGRAPAVQLLDARAPDRFRGENETLDPVGGHIPGAANRFFQLNLQEGRFKPAQQLQAEFAAALPGQDLTQLVHQCGSGVTACHNLLALAHAGVPMGRLYAGSWSEWCADSSRPRAVGSAG